MAASSPPPEAGDDNPRASRVPAVSGFELQTCTGFGWVTFDRASSSTSAGASQSQAPGNVELDSRVAMLRCIGSRLSQSVVPPAPRRGALQADSRVPRSMAGFSEVSDETWALACAGNLSMIVPPVAAGNSGASTDGEAALLSRRREQWSRCRARCAGVTVRLDTVVAASGEQSAPQPQAVEQVHAPASASTSAVASSSSVDSSEAAPRRPKVPEPDGEAQPKPSMVDLAEDFGRAGYRGVEAVAGRAKSVILTAGGAAREVGPRRFAENTASTAGKILEQAGKIVKRSAEQVSSVAAVTWRLAGRSSSSDDHPPAPGGG